MALLNFTRYLSRDPCQGRMLGSIWFYYEWPRQPRQWNWKRAKKVTLLPPADLLLNSKPEHSLNLSLAGTNLVVIKMITTSIILWKMFPPRERQHNLNSNYSWNSVTEIQLLKLEDVVLICYVWKGKNNWGWFKSGSMCVLTLSPPRREGRELLEIEPVRRLQLRLHVLRSPFVVLVLGESILEELVDRPADGCGGHLVDDPCLDSLEEALQATQPVNCPEGMGQAWDVSVGSLAFAGALARGQGAKG